MRLLLLTTVVLVLAACGGGSSGSGAGPTPTVTSVKAPLPPDPGSRYDLELDHVSCAAAGDCAATGVLFSHAVARPLLLVENRGAWTVSVPPLPQNLPPAAKSNVGLGAVACPAAGRCIAVATADSGARSEPLVFTQRGKGWRETILPLPAGAKGGGLNLVSCPAVGACTAAGGYLDHAGDEQSFFVPQSGASWGRAVRVQLPPNAALHPQASFGEEEADINSLSCGSARDCSAVSIYLDRSGSPQGLLLTETDGNWASGVEAHLPANATTKENSYLYPVIGMAAVSCATAADCTAVGGYGDAHSNIFGLTVTEHAGRWADAKEVPVPANAGPDPQEGNAPAPPMYSIACPSAGSCVATGEFRDKGGTTHGLLLTEQAGKWTPSEVVPSDGAVGPLACTSAGNCLAVGSVLAAEHGGRWGRDTAIPLPPPGAGKKAGGYLTSISCPPAGSCVAIGTYTDAAGKQQGLITTIPRP
jgi:hypothetical protein